jgi:hypothetical protein
MKKDHRKVHRMSSSPNNTISAAPVRRKRTNFSRNQLLSFVVVFAVIGGIILFKTFAATGPVVATVEAERMVLPTGASVLNDANASGGQTVQMISSGTKLTSTVTLASPAASVSVVAKGTKCHGNWPTMRLAIDGKSIIPETNVNTSSWRTFSATSSLTADTHNFEITYSRGDKCRPLYVDVTSVYGSSTTPPPTPTPTVSLSVSPSSINAGSASTLTWNSANATSCSASDAWSGAQQTSGSTSTGVLNITSTYSLTCSGAGGSAKASATVTVANITPPPPPPTGSLCPNLTLSYCVPFDPQSPWNTPIASNPTLDPKSSTYINAVADNNLPLTSDPDQYTVPIYLISDQTPVKTVNMSCYYSTYDNGDNSRVGHGCPAGNQSIPVPAGASGGIGSDGQIILWDPVKGLEYGFWQFAGPDSSGNYTATNGWRYHTTTGYYGRFADGLAGRGGGTPYSAGLVRKWEVDQGHIDHALAFAYNSPSSNFVYPASKSDGGNFGGIAATDLPEGARLQLNPALTDTDFNGWGLSNEAKIMARALQKYGMYTIDHSGSSKVYVEDRKTAGWGSNITRSMLSNIPWSQFRVVTPPPVQ